MKIVGLAFIICVSVFVTQCGTQQSAENKDAKTDSIMPSATTETPIEYNLGNQVFKSIIAYPSADSSKRPVVLVVPEWWGVNDYTRSRVKQLAELGYIAMAVDMYGNGKTAETPDSAGILATPFYKDPQLAKNNFEAALAKIKTLPQADTQRIAAIGYCFGGGMVLNMARLGEPLKGIVSFHGSLNGGITAKKGNYLPAILVCHGDADSMVPATDVTNFKKEMDNAAANYTFIGYPGAKHAFTNPNATAVGEKFKLDIKYDEAADKASWAEMKTFLAKVFQ